MEKHARLGRSKKPSARLGAAALGCALCASASLGGAQWSAPSPADRSVEERLLEARSVLERGRARRSEIDEELSSLNPRKEALKKRLLRDARSLYRVSRGGLLPIAGGLDAMLNHASRIGRLERLVENEARTIASLEQKRNALRKEASEWDLRIAEAERELSTLERARIQLAEQRAAQAMFESAFSTASVRSSDGRIPYGLSIVSGGLIRESFFEQRGNLALPVSGPTSIQEGRRAESDGMGLEFAATPGAAVRAAAAGKVVFAERYGSYGQLVILDHGDRYYTVYGGLANIEVQVGDDLSKSARVGRAGTAPIYFEVRRGTKAQDARAWLGI